MTATRKGIPEMPRGVRLLRYWPAKEPIRILGCAKPITDVDAAIRNTLARLDATLNGRDRIFTVQGLIDRLAKFGVLVEIEPEQKRRRKKGGSSWNIPR